MTAGFWEKVAEQLATGHTSSECSSQYAVLREAPRKKPAAKEGVALTGVVLIDDRGGLKGSLGQYISSIQLLNLNTAFTEQVNGKLANDRIHGYTYVRKKILAPLVLQPAPSLVYTSVYKLAPLPTRVNDAYAQLQLRGNDRMGGGASEWHSMREHTRSVCRSFQSMRGRTHGVRRLRGQSRPIISK